MQGEEVQLLFGYFLKLRLQRILYLADLKSWMNLFLQNKYFLWFPGVPFASNGLVPG